MRAILPVDINVDINNVVLRKFFLRRGRSRSFVEAECAGPRLSSRSLQYYLATSG
jgi:hypothetical protein